MRPLNLFLATSVLILLLPLPLMGETIWTNSGASAYAFDSATPGIVAAGPISYSGLVGVDAIDAIDFHPTTDVLYGFNSANGRLYTLSTSSGAATLIGTSATTPNRFIGMTFEGPGTIRIVHIGGAQFRIDSATGGLLATDTPTLEDGLNGIAYDDATSTTFGLEDGTFFLHRIGSPGGAPFPPSSGLTTLIGPSAIFTTRSFDMDISATTGIAYATDGGGGAGGTSNLYTVNLVTGAGTYVGALALRTDGIAVGPIPEPSANLLWLVMATATVVTVRSRHRDGRHTKIRRLR